MNFVDAFNVFETCLWTVIAIILAVKACRTDKHRRWLLAASLTLLLFAASEWKEYQTGAWWRPYWLALWKGACILTLIGLGVVYRRIRRSDD